MITKASQVYWTLIKQYFPETILEKQNSKEGDYTFFGEWIRDTIKLVSDFNKFDFPQENFRPFLNFLDKEVLNNWDCLPYDFRIASIIAAQKQYIEFLATV